MVWFVENCWWIVLIVFAIVICLAIALYVITKKEKKIKNDFKEKILFLEKVGDDVEKETENDVVAEKEDVVVEAVQEEQEAKTTKKTSTAKKAGTKKSASKSKSGAKKPASKTSSSTSSAKKTSTTKKTSTAKKSASEAESK